MESDLIIKRRMKRKELQTALSSSHLKIEKDDGDYAVMLSVFTKNQKRILKTNQTRNSLPISSISASYSKEFKQTRFSTESKNGRASIVWTWSWDIHNDNDDDDGD